MISPSDMARNVTLGRLGQLMSEIESVRASLNSIAGDKTIEDEDLRDMIKEAGATLSIFKDEVQKDRNEIALCSTGE